MPSVYLIRSQMDPEQRYIGLTYNLKKRLQEHNRGECISTSDYRSWTVEVSIYFRDHKKAAAYEQYLKTGSGRAVASKRFW